jgi:hypothetical protein
MVAFCALAFALNSATLFDRTVYARDQGTIWPLLLLALLSGSMALWIRRSGNMDRADIGQPSRIGPATPGSGLTDLAAWRSARSRDFTNYDLKYLPALPTTSERPAGGKRATTRKKAPKDAMDPWLRVLDQLEGRGRDSRK